MGRLDKLHRQLIEVGLLGAGFSTYLTAVAPLLAYRKQPPPHLISEEDWPHPVSEEDRPHPVSEEDWRTLRAARYAAQLVGSPQVADIARQLSEQVGEPQARAGADFSPLFVQLIHAMQADLQRGVAGATRLCHPGTE